jgi:uncharacterized protein YjiS (DUF1127 family)
MSSTLMSPSTPSRKPALPAFSAAAMVRLADAVVLMLAKQRSRFALSQLDDRMLRDIGLDRATAAHEAEQPIWR